MTTPTHKGYSATETVPEYLSRIGAKGGAARSERKKAAARINGAKGGRPRKKKGSK